MKIGITCYPTYGGSGAVATELGLELARRGHEVHFITYDSPFRLHGYAERIFFHQVETRMTSFTRFTSRKLETCVMTFEPSGATLLRVPGSTG